MLYTTNAIESLNARRAQGSKDSFPDNDSICKIMCLAIRNATKKWKKPVPNWAAAWEKSVCRHVWGQGEIVRKIVTQNY